MSTKDQQRDEETRRVQEQDEKQDTEQPVRRPRELFDGELETSDFRIPRF